MDPALPPGGLYRIFEQYDAIKSHGARDDGPPPDDDDPPWEPPPAPAAPPAAKAPPTKVTGFTTPLSQQDDGKVTVDRPGPPQEVLTDATSDRPRGKPPSWKHDRIEQMQEELGRRKMLTDLSRRNRGSFARDEYGMQKAYENTPTSGTYYDPKTRTMYIRGSQTGRDWYDDFFRVPAWGESHDIEMYDNASKAYDKLLSEGKPVDRVVGHSLGGSVALQLQKDRDIPLSRTFGAPVLDFDPGVTHKVLAERYRHPLDPVSVLDRNATWGPLKGYPHMYGGFKETFDEPAPYLLDTGTKAGLTSFVV
jgi:hypothetical protein